MAILEPLLVTIILVWAAGYLVWRMGPGSVRAWLGQRIHPALDRPAGTACSACASCRSGCSAGGRDRGQGSPAGGQGSSVEHRVTVAAARPLARVRADGKLPTR
jgi:hypothetical protein